MPAVPRCVGLYMNRLNMGQRLPVLCYFIEWIQNVLILLPFQLRVLYKYYSAGIMHMNEVSRFNLEALSMRLLATDVSDFNSAFC